MGIVNRISVLFQAKVLGLVDSLEDPRETLTFACQRQEELLANVRLSLVEVAASKHQLSARIQRLEERLPQLEDQARRAVAASRDDLARLALERRQSAGRQLEELRRQLTDVGSEEQKLKLAERRFTSAVEAFRARRDVLSARYTAAQAQFEAQVSLAGLSGELNGIGQGIRRAESKIERMQARATALDDLISSGAIENLSGDQIEEELRRHSDPLLVEEQLQALKQQQREGESK